MLWLQVRWGKCTISIHDPMTRFIFRISNLDRRLQRITFPTPKCSRDLKGGPGSETIIGKNYLFLRLTRLVVHRDKPVNSVMDWV